MFCKYSAVIYNGRMLYPKIENCVKKAENCKYVLVTVVAKRAKDLAVRTAGQFEAGKEKEISYALREVFDGKLVPAFLSAPKVPK